MKKMVSRLAVIAIGAISVIAVTAAPAMAMPSGIGWSGSWTYTSTTALTAHVQIPGATLSASGVDAGNSRGFTVTLTDTAPADSQCAQVSWQDGLLNTTTSTCGPAITFTPYGEDADVSAKLCLQSPTTHALTHCNILDIPSSYNESYIRNAGWGFNWAYYLGPKTEHQPEDWYATLSMGSMSFNLYGIDNIGGSTGRFLEPFLVNFSGSYLCGSAQILGNPSPASSATICGPNQSQQMQVTTEANAGYGSGAQACVWSEFSIKGHPNPHDCLTMFVPVPS